MVRERSRLARFTALFTMVGATMFALATPAAADLYRWVDAKGVVNYSNVPPPQGIAAKRIAETEPTVSVIPPPEDRAERQQAAREAALLRRIEQLEDELAALRRASAPAVAYTYPVPPAEVTYPASVVYPYAIYSWPIVKPSRGHGFVKPGRVHGFKPRHPRFGAHRAPLGKPVMGVPRVTRPGLTVRARF